jgi:hypothetical protein
MHLHVFTHVDEEGESAAKPEQDYMKIEKNLIRWLNRVTFA